MCAVPLHCSASPLLLSLQELAVGIDLHVQGQFHIQELLVLIQLQLHFGADVGDLALLVGEQTSTGVTFLGQS